MPSGQTSYIQPMVVALPGMLDRPLGGTQEVESKTVGAAVATGIPEGVGLTRVADDTVKLPALAADITANFQGIAVRLTAREPHNATVIVDDGTGMYVAKDQIPCLRTGVIYVNVEGTVAQDGAVYCRYAAGAGGSQLGAFRADADTATAAIVPNAKYLEGRTGAGLVRVRLGV